MLLLVGNPRRPAEANRLDDSLLRDSETDDQAPRNPHIGGRRWTIAPEHVASRGRGELDARMRDSQSLRDNEVGNAALYNHGNAAHDYQGNAAYKYQGNAAQSYWGRTAQFYLGNAASEQIMNQPPWPFIPPWGPWFPPPGFLSSSPRAQTVEASESDSTPCPSGMEEDTVTPFVLESERGDLLSSEDSELSEGEGEMIAPPAKHPKAKKGD